MGSLLLSVTSFFSFRIWLFQATLRIWGVAACNLLVLGFRCLTCKGLAGSPPATSDMKKVQNSMFRLIWRSCLGFRISFTVQVHPVAGSSTSVQASDCQASRESDALHLSVGIPGFEFSFFIRPAIFSGFGSGIFLLLFGFRVSPCTRVSFGFSFLRFRYLRLSTEFSNVLSGALFSGLGYP